MKCSMTSKCILAGAAVLAAASLAACGGDGHNGTPPQTVAPQQYTQFSAFVKSTYALGPDTTPIEINALQFSFDVQDDPTAFDALLM